MRRFLNLIVALLIAAQPVIAQQVFGGGSGLPAGGTSSNMLIGTPAWTTVFPNGMTGSTQATGDSTLKVSTDQFVALAIQGVNPASAVNEATAAVLPNTPTYSNGTAGVGATLTAGANAALTVDGTAVALNDRVLVKNQATAANNGVYTETQVGTGSVPWILTRATDYNTPSNINYTGIVSVLVGTANANTNWLLTSTITTIGTDAINYTQQTTGAGVTTGGVIKCKPPLTLNAVMIGQGGATCGTLASTGANGQVLLSGGTSAPAFGNIAGVPQGRLTLTSGSPVMSSDVTAGTTIYYDNYVGNAITYYNGTGDAADNIAAGEISDALPASSTGVVNSGDLFDEFYDHVSGTICHATNGSGGGWSSDTGGSTTVRGTGYSQIHNTRGYWTNQGTVTHCYNGATDEGPFSADRLTHLGTFDTTAAGTTAMVFSAAAASGGPATAPVMGLSNDYNRVVFASTARDSKASWTYGTGATWRAADSSNTNRVTWVDGLGQVPVQCSYLDEFEGVTGATGAAIGCDEDSTSANPLVAANSSSTPPTTGVADEAFIPKIGLHYGQAVEYTTGTTSTYIGTSTGSVLAMQLVVRVPM